MKRINFKFLLILIVVAVVTFGGLFLLRRFQINRNAGGKLEIARQRLKEGKTAQAMELFAQYVELRPNDNEAFADYSKLLLGRANAPDATRNDVAARSKITWHIALAIAVVSPRANDAVSADGDGEAHVVPSRVDFGA